MVTAEIDPASTRCFDALGLEYMPGSHLVVVGAVRHLTPIPVPPEPRTMVQLLCGTRVAVAHDVAEQTEVRDCTWCAMELCDPPPLPPLVSDPKQVRHEPRNRLLAGHGR